MYNVPILISPHIRRDEAVQLHSCLSFASIDNFLSSGNPFICSILHDICSFQAVSGAEQQVEEGSGEDIPIEKRETNVKKIRERLMMARIESPVGEIFSVEAPKIRLFEVKILMS